MNRTICEVNYSLKEWTVNRSVPPEDLKMPAKRWRCWLVGLALLTGNYIHLARWRIEFPLTSWKSTGKLSPFSQYFRPSCRYCGSSLRWVEAYSCVNRVSVISREPCYGTKREPCNSWQLFLVLCNYCTKSISYIVYLRYTNWTMVNKTFFFSQQSYPKNINHYNISR
jgi:hypothetical protein